MKSACKQRAVNFAALSRWLNPLSHSPQPLSSQAFGSPVVLVLAGEVPAKQDERAGECGLLTRFLQGASALRSVASIKIPRWLRCHKNRAHIYCNVFVADPLAALCYICGVKTISRGNW